MYETIMLVYEEDICGEYSGEPYEYRLKTSEIPTNKDYKDLIFQICEIERIPNIIIMVDITISKDEEYFDHDEFELEIEIVRTEELSEYIQWDKCPNLRGIYKVDKEKSKMTLLEFNEKEKKYDETNY